MGAEGLRCVGVVEHIVHSDGSDGCDQVAAVVQAL